VAASIQEFGFHQPNVAKDLTPEQIKLSLGRQQDGRAGWVEL
jgi:hypothetical protein